MSSIDMFTRLNNDAAVLRARLETQTRQANTGRRTEALGDLGAEVPRTVSLRGDIGRREVYGRTVDVALGRTGVMQESLSRFTEIAREFRTTVTQRINRNDPTSLVTVQQQARAALTEVAYLLNTTHAGAHLFAGSDQNNPPITDPEALATGQMAQDVAAEIATLGVNDAATVLNNTRTIAQSTVAGTTPFSAHLTADELLPPSGREARQSIPISDGELLGYGLFANRNTNAASTGETTGSWSRDLLRNLMSIAALTPAQMAQGAEFDKLVTGIREGFASAEFALGEEAGALGQVEARMTNAKGRHADLMIVLREQLSDIEDVNMADAISRLQATRISLEASYRAIASIGDLTLSRFLR